MFFKNLWKGIKAIGHAIAVALIFVWSKILFPIIKWVADLVTDEKNQGDERRFLGIACYVIAFYLGISIPKLVIITKDLVAAGSLAVVISAFLAAGAKLFDIARQADAKLIDNPTVSNIISTVKDFVPKEVSNEDSEVSKESV